MITAIIIDDEQHCIDRLSRLLQQNFASTIQLARACHDVEEGLSVIPKIAPDVIFLDVQLRNKTGFELLQQLGRADFKVIFTTAYDQYAVQAFKFSALDYLLKPVDPDDLARAVAKLTDQKERNETAAKLEVLLYNLKNIQGASKRICVPVSGGMVFLQVSDIVRCQSDVNYTYLFLHNGQKLLVAKTLKEFEELLSAYGFFRIHNSHLVNLAYVKSYNKGKGGYVTMTDNSTIEVSTRRKESFLNRLTEL